MWLVSFLLQFCDRSGATEQSGIDAEDFLMELFIWKEIKGEKKKTMLLLIEWHFSPIDYVILLTELISFASSDEIGLFRSILNLENVHTYHVTVVARTLSACRLPEITKSPARLIYFMF